MSTFSYEKILNITNIVAKNNIEEISNITDKTLPNFVDILNKPAKERKGFKYIDDDIQEPYLELENYFFKINYKNNYSKLFIKKLYNLSNVYFYDFQEEPNINLYNGIVLNKDELIECHKNEYYDLTFENFCKGKLSIYNINTRCCIEKLKPSKKHLIFEKLLKLLNNPDLDDIDKKYLLFSLEYLDDEIIKLINNYDFYGNVPKIIDKTNKNTRTKNMVLLLLNELGFDIIIFRKNGKISVESKIDIPIINLDKHLRKSNLNMKIDNFIFIIFCVLDILIYTIFFKHIAFSEENFSFFIFLNIVFLMMYAISIDLSNRVKNFLLKILILVILIISFILSFQYVKSYEGELILNEENITEYYLYETINSDKGKIDVIATISDKFFLYENNLYGYIYVVGDCVKIQAIYGDDYIIPKTLLNSDEYIKCIPIKDIIPKDVSEFSLTLKLYNYSNIKNVKINIEKVNTLEELINKLNEYGLEY